MRPGLEPLAVVVTGAAGDIGQALAEAFLADGHRVFGADIVPVEPRDGLVPVRVDVTDRSGVFALAERAAAESAGLRIWINAAGLVRVVNVLDADAEDWDRIIAANLTGTFHGCSAALAVMRRQGFGVIVNLGSLSGQVGGTGVHPAYGASKAGVHALTKTYALEGAKYGVRCNAIAPSVLDGAMGRQFGDRQRERLAAANPLRRLGRVEELIGAVRYLTGDGASYTNGVILPINGGSYV